MDRCSADEVVISQSAMADPLCRDRVQRLLSRIDCSKVSITSQSELSEKVATLGPRHLLERGGLARRGQSKRLIVLARLEDGDIVQGYRWNELRNGAYQTKKHGVLCHSAIEIQSVVGCAFDCTYCPYTSFLCINVDVEYFADRVTELARSRRAQRLYKLNNRSDTLGLEPEYGLAPALVTRFSQIDGRYLMLYSKGHEVDALTKLDHRQKTIASFTLTPEPVATLLEQGAAPPVARLDAMRKLGNAGYPIRVRFSPIVPLTDWERIYEELIKRLAAACRPEMVTMWMLSMIDFGSLGGIVPLDKLDARLVNAASDAAVSMKGQKGAPFPPVERARIYERIASLVREHCPSAAVSLCLETEPVWDALGEHVVPRDGGNMLCNCGPKATPDALVKLGTRAAMT